MPPRAAANPAPKIRLSHSEVSTADLHTPGNLPRLLRKLNNLSQSRQIGRGTACRRCKTKKSKCDGSRPCKTCLKENLPCDDSGGGGEAARRELPVQQVDWPVPAPQSYKFAHLQMSRAAIPPPLEVGNIMRLGMDYGIPVSKISAMFSAMPPKLLGALGQLLQRLMAAGPPPLDPMPEQLEYIFAGSSSVVGLVLRRSLDGVCDSATFTSSWDRVAGAHSEEVSARLASKDMPSPTSEYRELCNHLNLLLHTMLNPTGTQQFIWPTLMNHVNQHVVGENWALFRYSSKPYANGCVVTGVALRPDEYDHATAQSPKSRGVFIECDMSGEELVNCKDLLHRERISVMVQSPAGFAKLERLADKVIEVFRLNDQLPPSSARASPAACSAISRTPVSHVPSAGNSPPPNMRFVTVTDDIAHRLLGPPVISAFPPNQFPASQPFQPPGNVAAFQPPPASSFSFPPVQSYGFDQPVQKCAMDSFSPVVQQFRRPEQRQP